LPHNTEKNLHFSLIDLKKPLKTLTLILKKPHFLCKCLKEEYQEYKSLKKPQITKYIELNGNTTTSRNIEIKNNL
jgi:hypothetical protein